MHVTPFIYFYGRCEEALDFYAAVFGGSYEVLTRNTATPLEHAHRLTPAFRDKVSAAKFRAGEMTIMGSDGAGPRELTGDDGNISLSVTMPDANAGARAFDALSDGGHVKVPFESVPWGGHMGVVQDRFATEWIITVD
jgi:PhnB protein